MKQVIDERVKLPPIAQSFLITAVGVLGITFFINDGAQVGLSDSFLMFRSIIVGGLTGYGVVSLAGDIRKGRTVKGITNEILKTIRRLYD